MYQLWFLLLYLKFFLISCRSFEIRLVFLKQYPQSIAYHKLLNHTSYYRYK